MNNLITGITNKLNKKYFGLLCCGPMFLFAVWTLLVSFVDIGLDDPACYGVGFSAVNSEFHDMTGVHWGLYHLTDYIEFLAIAVVLFFALIGAEQLYKGRSLKAVDYDILALGRLYIATMIVFALFEVVEINYRPILIDGVAETSYPSSTTLLVCVVVISAMIYAFRHMESGVLKTCIMVFSIVYMVFMVTARLLSGVHWLTDIFGGLLLTAGLISLHLYDLDRGEQLRKEMTCS